MKVDFPDPVTPMTAITMSFSLALMSKNSVLKGGPTYVTRGVCLSPTPDINESRSCSDILAMAVLLPDISFASRLCRVTT